MKDWTKELHTIFKWKKYSQAYEECYLAHILNNIESKNKFLVELGAWDGYHLSNTRYFIEDLKFGSLLIDGDNHGNEEVKKHFITKDNIVHILKNYNCPKEFDLFCIDLDGNDIYILEEVLSQFTPSVIVAEFNPIIPIGESKAIQYDPNHTWNNDDYYGFSFEAGCLLANKFGYTVIFQNDNLNMYFVENQVLAKSLNTTVFEIDNIESNSYTPTHYHPQSNKTTWVDYE